MVQAYRLVVAIFLLYFVHSKPVTQCRAFALSGCCTKSRVNEPELALLSLLQL